MSYDPDPDAIPYGLTFTRQLSQRDLSLQIPINYVTAPGVTLSAACFASKRYEDVTAGKCFSNLLVVGFDRYIVDLYWDATRHLWSLCPVQLGPPTGSSTTSSVSSSSSIGSSSTTAAARLDARASVSTTTTLDPSTSTASPGSTPTLAPGELVDVGPYSCTTSINFQWLTSVLNTHLETTQNKLNATLKYLVLNLHAAAPATDPEGSASAPTSADLPVQGSLLSSILSSHLSEFYYTPEDLYGERADLNASASWYSGGETEFEPNGAYFQTDESKDIISSPNGWPCESFIEMDFGKRMLVGYGQVDPQMSAYNFSGDSSVIFPQGYLQSNASVTLNNADDVTSGCFYQADTYNLGKVNNSWATYDNLVAPAARGFTGASNLTYCGISPLLNKTLNGITADKDYKAYQNFVQSTVWSWGDGEPRNDTESDDGSHPNRCAALNSTSGYWQSENCAATHYNACRNTDEIYEWTISNAATTYLKAGITCPKPSKFTVPNTALENTYLLQKWRETIADADINDELLWVNFNDLDVKSCWVVGQDETCPYLPPKSDSRDVIVPVVSAVIVFVLAALTVFVKCAANRQMSKSRRRRGSDGGGDYEGVPS